MLIANIIFINRCIPSEEPIDLINVAFEQRPKGKHGKQGGKPNRFKYREDEDLYVTNFDVPDRVTGRNGVAELRQMNPHRTWNFVEVYITVVLNQAICIMWLNYSSCSSDCF